MVSSCFAHLNGQDYFTQALPEATKVTEGYIMLGTGAGLAGLAHFADDPVQKFMSTHAILPHAVNKFADSYVDYYWAFGVSALGAVGRGALDGNYSKPLRYWAASSISTIAVTYALKYGVGRLRPNGENTQSFPSGHSSVAFSTATMLQMWYGWEAGIPAYTMAILTAFQRLDDNKHWLSDVIFGATLGIVLPYMLFQGEEQAENSINFIPFQINFSVPLAF